MNSEDFWHAVACRLEAGTSVYAVLVVANTRGSPGTLGARLLVDREGHVDGTIGGGIMESNLIESARQQLAAGKPKPPALQRLVHRKKGRGERSGLICAGEQTNLHLCLDPARDAAVVRRFFNIAADQSGRSALLEISSRGLRVIADESGDVAVGKHLIEDARGWRYLESSLNPRRLVLVGGGHCGRALARLAVDVGYSVVVYDNRPEVLDAPGWPEPVRRRTLANYAELGGKLAHPGHSIVVVMTATVFNDIDALESVALLGLRWLGVMGSVAKIHKIRTDLRARGVPAARVDAIHGPIGMPMKSDTPPEIAVSIMGQLLSEQPEVVDLVTAG